MGKCKIDPNNPKGAKCLKRFTVKCVGKECKNYEETNFERITASPSILASQLITREGDRFQSPSGREFDNVFEATEDAAIWLAQPYMEE